MNDDELREITEQIWGGVEYGNSAGARKQLRDLLATTWDNALDWVADGYQDTSEWKARNPFLVDESVSTQSDREETP